MLSCEAAGLGCWQGQAPSAAEQWPDPAPGHSFVPVWHCSASGLGQGYFLQIERGKPKRLQGDYVNTPDINLCLSRMHAPSELIGTKEKVAAGIVYII